MKADTTNSKHEIRNSKQIQMLKKRKILNAFVFGFGISDFEFVSDFDIRISDFGEWVQGSRGN
jgi:hypothetical protein